VCAGGCALMHRKQDHARHYRCCYKCAVLHLSSWDRAKSKPRV
jgi:hypothetical protein